MLPPPLRYLTAPNCLSLSGPSTDEIIYIKAFLNFTDNLWVLISAAFQEMLYDSPEEKWLAGEAKEALLLSGCWDLLANGT